MKTIKIIFILFVLFSSLCGFSQKVKLKKDKVLIDDVEVYTNVDEGTVNTLSTLSGTEFITIVATYYDERNPARNLPNGHNFPATIRKAIYTVKFLETGRELFTDLSFKDIIKSIYNSKMVDEKGEIDGDKMNIFITKYNNDNLRYKIN